MAESSSSDCYLCGAQNEPDASYCARCNGQLLRIPVDEESEDHEGNPESASDEPTADTTTEADGEKPSRRRRTRKGTLQDQRLSDALGLDTDIEPSVEDVDEGSLVDTVVTSIPRATPSASIPLIGTRAGAVPQAAMGDREFGKKTFAFLGVLLLVTGWLGYRTLIKESPEPDSIAFTGTTTTSSTSSTTTIKPRRTWQVSEVETEYGAAFLRVEIYECRTELEKGETRVPIVETLGVSVNTHNVLVGGSRSGDVAVMRSRTGAASVGLIDVTPDGSLIATTTRATSRNLGLDPAIELGEAKFFVNYDEETNVVEGTETKQNARAEIATNEFGDAHTVFLEGRSYPVTPLADVDTLVEFDPEIELSKKATYCDTAAALRTVLPEGVERPEEPLEIETDPDAVPNEE